MAHNSHSHGPVDDPNFVNDRPYETRDFFAFNSVLKWIFCLFVFVGIASAITLVIYNVMVPRSAERSSAFPLPQVRALPPEPRLQANPVLDIRMMREQESAALTTYGRDPKTGDVHIPVAKAIDSIVQEGLPTRSTPGKPNLSEPNEPSRREGEAPPGTQNSSSGTTNSAMPHANDGPVERMPQEPNAVGPAPATQNSINVNSAGSGPSAPAMGR